MKCLNLLTGKRILCKCDRCEKGIEKSKKEFDKSDSHFCSKSCSASFSNIKKDRSISWSNEKKKKMSDWAKNNAYDIAGFNIRKSENDLKMCNIPFKKKREKTGRKQTIIEKICPECHKNFSVFLKHKNRKYCSLVCSYHNPNVGGYRKNSGIGKMGWYKGYFCQSSWELAWIIYSLDHDVKFVRNTIGFPYDVGGKRKKYFPDFLLEDGTYLEIKGWGFNTKEKIQQFPHKLQVLYKLEMKQYLDYAIFKHGKNFIEVYEK